MSFDVFWFLPTSGDTRYLGTSDFGRAPSNEYLRSIAVTSEKGLTTFTFTLSLNGSQLQQ